MHKACLAFASHTFHKVLTTYGHTVLTTCPNQRVGAKSSGVRKMKPYDLKSMSLDELWSLHEFVSAALARKISAETARLDQRLRQLRLGAVPHNVIFPKYRNPAEPSETWAGRGKKPRWLTAQLKSGKRIDDFRTDLATA